VTGDKVEKREGERLRVRGVSVWVKGGVRVWGVGGEERLSNRRGRKEKWVGSE